MTGWRLKTMALLIAWGVLAGATPLAAQTRPPPDDPLNKIIEPKPGNSICFRRDYDAAHLKRHPRQTVVSVLLSFKHSAGERIERITLRQRGRAQPHYIAAGCGFSDNANINTSGQRMIREFKGRYGYQCSVTTAPMSAEEAGFFLVDLKPDGSTATLYLDFPIATWRGKDGLGAYADITLERDDRVFRLNRTDPADCSAMEQALPSR